MKVANVTFFVACMAFVASAGRGYASMNGPTRDGIVTRCGEWDNRINQMRSQIERDPHVVELKRRIAQSEPSREYQRNMERIYELGCFKPDRPDDYDWSDCNKTAEDLSRNQEAVEALPEAKELEAYEREPWRKIAIEAKAFEVACGFEPITMALQYNFAIVQSDLPASGSTPKMPPSGEDLTNAWSTVYDASAFHVALTNVVGIQQEPLMLSWGSDFAPQEAVQSYTIRKMQPTTPEEAGLPIYGRAVPLDDGAGGENEEDLPAPRDPSGDTYVLVEAEITLASAKTRSIRYVMTIDAGGAIIYGQWFPYPAEQVLSVSFGTRR